MYFKVFQVTRGAEEVVCKGGAAGVVGQKRLKLARFLWGCRCGRSRVLLHAAIAGGVPYREGKEMGRGCLPGSFLSLLVFDLCRPLKEA